MLSGNGLKAAQPCPARATEDRPRGTRRRAGKPRGIQCRTAAPGYFSPGLRYERPNLHDGSDDIGFRASWLAGDGPVRASSDIAPRSEEHTSELQSLMRISYAVFCLKKKRHKIMPISITSEHTRTTQKISRQPHR